MAHQRVQRIAFDKRLEHQKQAQRADAAATQRNISRIGGHNGTTHTKQEISTRHNVYSMLQRSLDSSINDEPWIAINVPRRTAAEL
jgi:hypothetical protein